MLTNNHVLLTILDTELYGHVSGVFLYCQRYCLVVLSIQILGFLENGFSAKWVFGILSCLGDEI